MKALQIVKYCALVFIGFVVVGEFILLHAESDDHAGGVFMGALLSFCSVTTATAAVMFEGILKNSGVKIPAVT